MGVRGCELPTPSQSDQQYYASTRRALQNRVEVEGGERSPTVGVVEVSLQGLDGGGVVVLLHGQGVAQAVHQGQVWGHPLQAARQHIQLTRLQTLHALHQTGVFPGMQCTWRAETGGGGGLRCSTVSRYGDV